MIRLANADDVPFIIHCLQLLRHESPTCADCPNDPDYWGGMLCMMFKLDTFIALVEEGKGVMLGVTQPTWYDCRLRTYEQLLYVKPEYRGGTIAARLIKRFCDIAREHGSIEIQAGSMTGIKEQSVHKLYKRLGFEDYRGGVRYRIS